MKLHYMKLRPTAKEPTYGTTGAGCFDLYCSEDTVLEPFVTTKVPTALAVEVPEGYVMTVMPRSSTACRGIQVFTGQVDSDYRGEVHVMAMPLTADGCPTLVRAGERIAQARLDRAEQVQFVEEKALSSTARGTSGYGSTGK